MFVGLPVCPELTRDHIPKARDVGHFLSVTGTVIRTSVTKVLEYERDYMCNKCRHVFSVQASFEQFYTFTPPASCPSEEGCSSFKFTCLSGSDSPPATCKDYQEIKIQEQVRVLFLWFFWCWFRESHPWAAWCWKIAYSTRNILLSIGCAIFIVYKNLYSNWHWQYKFKSSPNNHSLHDEDAY